MKSKRNNSRYPLLSGSFFNGVAEETTPAVEITVTMKTDTNATLNIEQSNDNINWDIIATFLYDTSSGGTTFSVDAVYTWFRVSLENTSNTNQSYLRLNTFKNPTHNTSVIAGVNSNNEVKRILVNNDGMINVAIDNFPTTQTITGNVNIDNYPDIQTIQGSVSVDNYKSVCRNSFLNSTQTSLYAHQTFTGSFDIVGEYTKVYVSVMCDVEIELTISQQGFNSPDFDKITVYTIPPTPEPDPNIAFEVPHVETEFTQYGLVVSARNTTGVDATYTRVNTKVFNDGYLDKLNDSVMIYGVDSNETAHKLLTETNGSLIVSSKVGQNSDFLFIPDATNSTSAIYADGQQPSQTTAGGWVYTNNGVSPNKINWYVYQDVTHPQYLVSEMESIYFVITQLTGATTLPFIGFYTMPNGLNDVVPNFAKSRLVFAPNNSVPETAGEYLLYVKSDPTHVRPEITNRYELTFTAQNSSKTLEQASNERLSLSTLSTNSTDATNANYFLFQQYGIIWTKTNVPLPVNDGKIAITGSVSVSSGAITETNSSTISSTLTSMNGKITACNTGAIVGSVSVSSGAITETNSSTISSTLTSMNGKITTCNTGAIAGTVSISGEITETNSNSIYNNIATMNNKIVNCDTNSVSLITSSIKSFPATTTRVKRQFKVSNGVISSINYYNDASNINFILLYNALPENVTVGTTAPYAVIALIKNHGETIDLQRSLFTTAITIAVSGDYDGATDPHGNGVYLCLSYY